MVTWILAAVVATSPCTYRPARLRTTIPAEASLEVRTLPRETVTRLVYAGAPLSPGDLVYIGHEAVKVWATLIQHWPGRVVQVAYVRRGFFGTPAAPHRAPARLWVLQVAAQGPCVAWLASQGHPFAGHFPEPGR